MSRHINDLLEEAEALIEKRANAKPTSSNSEDVAKIATLLMADDAPPAAPESVVVETIFEKVAHAIALVETLESIEQLTKLAQFEDQARASGYTEKQIEEFIEKRAMNPVHKSVKYLADLAHAHPAKAGGVIGAGVGATVGVAGAIGHHMGKKKGRAEATSEINKAFEDYGSV